MPASWTAYILNIFEPKIRVSVCRTFGVNLPCLHIQSRRVPPLCISLNRDISHPQIASFRGAVDHSIRVRSNCVVVAKIKVIEPQLLPYSHQLNFCYKNALAWLPIRYRCWACEIKIFCRGLCGVITLKKKLIISAGSRTEYWTTLNVKQGPRARRSAPAEPGSSETQTKHAVGTKPDSPIGVLLSLKVWRSNFRVCLQSLLGLPISYQYQHHLKGELSRLRP